jgi:hypothetical protein
MSKQLLVNSRNQPGYKQRAVDTRDVRERFLIVCEGERTEPNYFRCFRVPKSIIEIDVRGLGYNTVSLVKKAIDLRNQDSYDQVWCVFDRDSWPAQNFNDALSLAKREKIKVAYSNEAFEIWYLLHFNYHTTAITRSGCIDKLSELLGKKYQKKQEDMYTLLDDKQSNAIQNARKLLSRYTPRNPERDNPSTTVHELVEQLNRFVS